MAEGDIGLLISLGLDPDSIKKFAEDTGQCVGMVEARIKDYQQAESAAYDEAVQRARGAGEELDRSLIGNRESVRLLSEEFGLRLPRAVTGAVAQALPEIASMGGALLGVFALEQAYKWGKVVNEQFFQIYTEGDQTIKNLDAAAAAAFKHAGEEATEMLTHFRTSLAGAFDIAQIDAHAAQLQRFHDAYKSLVGKTVDEVRTAMATVSGLAATVTEATAQGLTSLEDVDKKVNELGQLQFEAHKRMAEVVAKEAKDTAAATDRLIRETGEAANRAAEAHYRAAMERYEANQKAYHASEEGLKRLMALQDHLGRQTVEEADRAVKAREREARAIKELGDKLDAIAAKEARNAEELGKEASKQIADIERLGNEQERAALRGKAEARQRIEDQHREAVAAIQSHEQQAQAIAALKGDYKAMADAAIAAYTAMGQASANYLRQLHEQHEEEEKDDHEATNAAIAEIGALAEGAAQLAGSKKAYYAVKAGEEVAAGVECIAEGTWPPNPLALIAAGIHFESAAEWAKLAGTSATRRGVGAGGVGGEFATSSGGEYRGQGTSERGQGTDYGERAVAGTGLAPGAAGPSGGRVSVYLFADSMELGRSMATHINNYVVTGGGELTASRALRSAPAQG